MKVQGTQTVLISACFSFLLFFISCASGEPKKNNSEEPTISQMDVELAKAIEKEDVDKIQYSINQGASLSTTSERGFTALSWAIFSKKPDLIAFLIKKGADVNAKSKGGGEPLALVIAEFVAYKELPIEVLVLAIEHGAELDGTLGSRKTTPLDNAASQCNTPLAELLVTKQVYLEPIEAYNDSTPLHQAAEKGCLPIVQLLIKNGVNLSPRNKKNQTPLDLAKKARKWPVVKYLKSQGAQ